MNSLPSPPSSPLRLFGSLARRNSELLDITTGNLWSDSPRRYLLQEFRNILGPNVMLNSPVPRPRSPMSRNLTPLSLEPDLNLEQNQLIVPHVLTGTQYGTPLVDEFSAASRHKYVFVIMGTFNELVPILTALKDVFEPVLSTGVQLELESPDVLGMKPDWELILRTLEPNSGVDTETRSMLYWMNFEEASTLRTYSDGWIVILSRWRTKDLLDR